MSLIVRAEGLPDIFEGTVVQLLESNDFEALINAKGLIESKLAALRDEQIARLRQQVQEQSALLGLTPAELFGSAPIEEAFKPTSVIQKAVKGAPKYKDPNSDATWSGKGKPPYWMKAYLEAGGNKEDLRIPSCSSGPGNETELCATEEVS